MSGNQIQEGKIVAAINKLDQIVKDEIYETLLQYESEDIEKAFYRVRIADGEIPAHPRTRSRYSKAINESELKYSFEYRFIGGLDKKKWRGNRDERIPEDSNKYFLQALESYLGPEAISAIAAYKIYKDLCEKNNVYRGSYPWFCKKIKRTTGSKDRTTKRKGEKAANSLEEAVFHFELSVKIPKHGDRPWQIVHIDHTQLDIEIIDDETGMGLGRPWLTIMVDAYTRRILALYLTFDPPSYRSNMMVIRECVRRYGRLPEVLVFDGGKDFHNVYFDLLLSRFVIHGRSRPWKKPHFGSTVERTFGVIMTQFIHNLLGNTKATKNVRQVTKAVNPKKNSSMELHCFS